ncbi:MAG: hypothetical protein KAI47_27005, partial [Deltaproteobacteria bacterium]|nr:hypothetical protein [Deltaproteobacteria bacterium]
MMLSIRLNLGVAALIVLMVLPLFGGCSAMDAAKPAASDGAIIDADAGLGEGYEIPSEREDIGVETGIDLMDGIDGEIQLVPPLLQKRLKEAKAGETVSLSPATNGVPLVIEVDEPLIIKAGVTLANKGTGEITIKAPAKGGCFRVETDAEVPVPTVIKGLACEVTRGAGLIVRGSGEFRGEELQFQVKAGVGVAIEGVKHVTLKNVQITGEQLAGDRKVAFPLLATDRPLIGLIASHVQMLDIESVEVDGFTGIGALLYETTSTWTTGSVANTVGVDVFVHGGKATLNGLSIATNVASNNPLLLAAGLVASGGATVETTKLTIKDNEGAGIVADHATMKHDDLLVA